MNEGLEGLKGLAGGYGLINMAYKGDMVQEVHTDGKRQLSTFHFFLIFFINVL